MDVVVQHLTMAAAQLYGHRRFFSRDFEPLYTDVTGLKLEPFHSGQLPWHRTKRDRLPLHAAGFEPDPFTVMTFHHKNGIVGLNRLCRPLNRYERPLLGPRIGISRTTGCLVHYIG